MTFDGVVESLGERLGMTIEDAGGAAAVEIDGTAVVLQDAGELLLLRADAGELPEKGRDALLASAMSANYLYQGTGGATLALDPGASRLHLQKYNWLERLDPDSVFEMLERFAATAAAWRRVVADCRSAEPAEPADSGNVGGDGFMQV